MQYRSVPKNGDKLPILGFGCMRFPTAQGKIDRTPATRMLVHAINKGVDYLDTAVPYHKGESESFVGHVLAEHGLRDRVKIATKLPHWHVHARRDMEAILDSQLRTLGTDRVDYYLLHALDGTVWDRIAEIGVVEFLDRALAGGRIVRAGFSFHGNIEDFKRIVDAYDWSFCQIQYNYLDTHCQAGTAGLEYAASRRLAVIVMEPLRGGKLAGPLPAKAAEVIAQAPTAYTPVQWALRWLWNRPEVTCVLSGMGTMRQLEENIETADHAAVQGLSPQDLQVVERIAGIYLESMKVGCTGCRYCMPCPHGVDIPGCFELYNHLHLFGEKPRTKYFYLARFGGVVSKPAHASLCRACGRCEPLCPQGIHIIRELKAVTSDIEGPLFKVLCAIGRVTVRLGLVAAIQRWRQRAGCKK